MELQPGEKYLRLKLGDTELLFFPKKDKNGNTFYSTTLNLFVSEKKQPETPPTPVEGV